jgi:hypothetical protein
MASEGPVTLAGYGTADHCDAYGEHRPRPLRFVWHHVLPQACGGATVADNLVQLCDTCHYAIHELLWRLKKGEEWHRDGVRGQREIAQRGWDAAVQVGTQDLIPHE